MDKVLLKSLKREFKIAYLFVFGNKFSEKDIDILIVSNDFENISFTKRKMLIQKTSLYLDPICLTLKEFERLKCSQSSLWSTISTKGERIL